MRVGASSLEHLHKHVELAQLRERRKAWLQSEKTASKLCRLDIAMVTVCLLVWTSQLHAGDFSQTRSRDVTLQFGRQLYASYCAACHGLDGRGGERAPDIATSREVQRLTDGRLVRLLEAGISGTGMPGFRSLGNTKLRELVRYLRVLEGQQPRIVLRGRAQSGKSIFFGPRGCSVCHMINGMGGFIASDLTNYGQTQSADKLREVITRPDQYLGSQNRATVVTMPNDRQYKGIVRNEDNFSLQLQTFDGAFHFFVKAEVRRIEQLPESLMPSDYGSRLNAQELDDLVSYLISVGQEHHSLRETAAPAP
jgi:cytochrome c oxidase cbb3-type subunit III